MLGLEAITRTLGAKLSVQVNTGVQSKNTVNKSKGLGRRFTAWEMSIKSLPSKKFDKIGFKAEKIGSNIDILV